MQCSAAAAGGGTALGRCLAIAALHTTSSTHMLRTTDTWQLQLHAPFPLTHVTFVLPTALIQRLNMTQKRVEHNLQRVNELKAEAAALERLKETVTAEPVYASSSSSAAPAARATSTVNSRASSTTTTSRASSSSNSSSSMATLTAPPAPVAARQQTGQPSEQQRQQEQQQQRRRRSMADRRRDRGLSSSLEIEEGLREFWYPAEFSSRLKTDVMVPFELLEQPWVLFRDEQGRPACVRDECAHRWVLWRSVGVCGAMVIAPRAMYRLSQLLPAVGGGSDSSSSSSCCCPAR